MAFKLVKVKIKRNWNLGGKEKLKKKWIQEAHKHCKTSPERRGKEERKI